MLCVLYNMVTWKDFRKTSKGIIKEYTRREDAYFLDLEITKALSAAYLGGLKEGHENAIKMIETK